MPQAVILTALPVEYLAVRAHLRSLQEKIHSQGTIYEQGLFATDGQTWNVGIAEIGEGNSGAAGEAERAIAYFNPDILFFVGTARGIKDVKIGDVVAATKVYSYESGEMDKVFAVRPEAGQSAYALIQRAKSEARKGQWVQRLCDGKSSQSRVFIAPIAAGEKVIDSRTSELFQFIRSSYNDAIAIEMEGFGFLKSAFAYPNIQALVIRGISDLIEDKNEIVPEEENKEERQTRASQNASAFAFELLAKLQIQTFQQPALLEALPESRMVQDNSENAQGVQATVTGGITNFGNIYIESFLEGNPLASQDLKKNLERASLQQPLREKSQSPVKRRSKAKEEFNLFNYVPTHLTESLAYFVDDSQTFRLMPIDLGTIWGLQRSRFIGLLVGAGTVELYENLKNVEFILDEALNENQSAQEHTVILPRREWIQLDIAGDVKSALVNALKHKSFSDKKILGFYCNINLEQLKVDGIKKLKTLSQIVFEKQFPSQAVAVVINISHPVNCFLMNAVEPEVETLKNQLRKIAPNTPIELLRGKATLSMFRNPLANSRSINNLSVIANSPSTDILIDRIPDTQNRTGLLFCSWIHHLPIDKRKRHEDIIDLYIKVKQHCTEQRMKDVYNQITPRDVVSDLSSLQFYLSEIHPNILVPERMKTIYEQLLKLSIYSFPQQSYEWICAYAESTDVEKISATLNVLANSELHMISDILIDVWINEINHEYLSIDYLRKSIFLYQNSEMEIDFKLESLFLAFLRMRQKSVSNQKKQKIQVLLDALMHVSPTCKKFYRFYNNQYEKEAEFLEQNDPYGFIFAIRTDVKFESAMKCFRASSTSSLPIPLCWLLSAIAPNKDSLKELLQLNPQKRAIFGLCTSEEWQQIRERPVQETQVLDCRRKRNLVFTSNSF